jgi:hypothetical protein
VAGKEHAYVLTRDWLGPSPAFDRDAALAELARRFLVGHGPAGERDLARWAGLPLRDSRAGLAAIATELEEREDGLIALAARRNSDPDLPPPRLLGGFDPVLLGWLPREPILGRHESRIVSGGVFRPFAMVGGRAVAGWKLEKGTVAIEPFGRIARPDRAALDADAADVERFLAA